MDGSEAVDEGETRREEVREERRRRIAQEREERAALDERSDHLPFALRAASRAVDEVLRYLLAQSELTDLPLNALHALVVARRGPVPVGTVAQRVGVSQQAASRLLAELERRGLVDKEPSYLDGRVRLVCTTEAGILLLDGLRRDLFVAVTVVGDAVGEDKLVALTESLGELSTVEPPWRRSWWW